MGWKRVVGKLLLVGAGMGCLAVVVIVLLPGRTAQLEAPAAEGGLSAEVGRKAAGPTGGGGEDVMRAPSPQVGLRDNGEEEAAGFPASGVAPPSAGTIAVGGVAQVEEPEDIPVAPAERLPPVLSPEEVAAAMVNPDNGGEDDGVPATVAEELPAPVADAGQPVAEAPLPADSARTLQGDRQQPEIVPVRDTDGDRKAEVSLPPPSATRQVQELLETLGYAPGPIDGIWGERTGGAWSSFARDAAGLAATRELAKRQAETAAEPSAPESPAPSGVSVDVEGDDERQAGRPSQEAAQPVVLPETLRGVMGYRMPLVSRQGVPDQVVSGVLIPAHTTFVILKPGRWELVGLEPDDVERLRDATARLESAAAVNEAATQPARRAWNPLRLFGRQGLSGSER